jgi:CPA2 family monovalent cation:H+ antiporter-2
MHDLAYLQHLLVILAAAALATIVASRLRTSPVLGYLIMGMIIGPQAVALIPNTKGIHDLAELGVVFLLFSIGLELSFRRLTSLRTEVFGLGTAQLVLTASAVGTVVWFIHPSVEAAIVIGSGVALSSTAIVMQLLSERGELSNRVGRSAFSILLLQDLAIVPMLALLPLLGGKGATDWVVIGLAVAKAAAALVAILLVGRFLLQPLFRAFAALRSQEIFVAVTLLAVLGTAWATEQVGLSLTLGAFLAGLMLAETEFRHQIETEIRPFQGLLLGLFFITIGMSIDLQFALANWWQVLVLVLGLVTLKASIIFGLSMAMGQPLGVALRTGLMLAQAGEFAFVLISFAVQDDLVPVPMQQMTIAVVSVSMALTPFLNVLGRWLATRVERVTAIGLAALAEENQDLKDHAIIAGFGRFGQAVARLLDEHRIPYVGFDLNPANVMAARAQGRPVHYGDVTRRDLLWAAGVDRARALIVATDANPAQVTDLVRRMHNELPDVRMIARARSGFHAQTLRDAGAEEAVPDVTYSAQRLAQSVAKAFDLPDDDLAKLLEEVEASSEGHHS